MPQLISGVDAVSRGLRSGGSGLEFVEHDLKELFSIFAYVALFPGLERMVLD